MTIAFADSPLDRADHLRRDPELIRRRHSTGSRILLFAGDRPLTDASGAPFWAPGDAVESPLKTEVFLGIDRNGRHHYAAQLDGEDLGSAALEAFPEADKFRDARAVAMKLGSGDAWLGVVAHAKSLTDWHARHRFCAVCGAPSEAVHGGSERRCPDCGASHFPRTDPVVIMLIEEGDAVLVGRGPKLPPNFYSALAGFVEPGESAEEAVARECAEEAGLNVFDITYVASQPWPWPSSLMMGFMARTTSRDVTLDMDEVDAARWITRDDVRASLAMQTPDLLLPPPIAIARNLIDRWVEEG